MSQTKARRKKKWLLGIGAGVLAAALGVGIWYFTAGSTGDPVPVYPFSYLGMTEYWGDTRESYGPVTTDKIQTVFLSETQTITEILVEPGDQVKEGDLLLRYDTTLSDLALERKRLEVEKLKLQLESAQRRLTEIRYMRPMQLPPENTDPENEEEMGTLLEDDYMLFENLDYDGKSNDRAIIVWVNNGLNLHGGILDDIFYASWDLAVELQTLNRPPEEEPMPEDPEEESTEATEATETTAGTDAPEEEEEGEGEGGYEPEPVYVGEFYIAIRTTQNNRNLCQKLTWQGMRVTRSGDGSYTFRFCNPLVPDYALEGELQEEEDDYDYYGSGYTSAQLAQMRAEQEEKIRELDLQLRMAEADYKLMLLEASDGNVYAKVDGVILSVLDPEEARLNGLPVLKLTGGGGFYVEGTVSELEKDTLQIGQEVTVNDWNTGMTYTGTVYSLGDYPSQDGYYNGMGNPNASYYPFLVFVDSSADLQEGRYVSIMYAASQAQSGIYLENPFLRTENGRSYVMVRGADGRLEQRFVTTGKTLWGSYTEILSGITEDDFLAFPYGKQVKVGMPTREADRTELYS